MKKFPVAPGRKVRAVSTLHQLEALERRRMLAQVSWDGGGDGVNWNDPNNWSNNQFPGSGDDVTLAAGANVNLVGASSEVKSLVCSRPLTVNGPLLQVNGAATFGGATKIIGY